MHLALAALTLLLAMARQDGGAFETAGGIKLLLDMASAASSPTSRPKSTSAAGAGKTLETFAGYIASVVNILDRATRSKGGLDARVQVAAWARSASSEGASSGLSA